MKKAVIPVATLLGCLLTWQSASAGDRTGVTEAMRAIPAAWSDAYFSIDVKGASNGEAVLNQPLDIEYEAAVPGYVSYLRISSHGDMTLVRDSTGAARSKGSIQYLVKPPLGSEQIVVLFSSAPLDSLFLQSATSQDLGADRTSADGLISRLAQLQSNNVKLADRRYRFVVATAPGGTEYTTRGIVRHVVAASGSKASLPSHIEFEFDSDRLTDQGRRDLDVFGEALVSDLRKNAVALEGHTDALGTDDYNMALSARRAKAVKQYLEDSFGIPASRLSAMGMGKSDPIAPNDTEADRQHNRRVDFVFSLVPAADGSH